MGEKGVAGCVFLLLMLVWSTPAKIHTIDQLIDEALKNSKQLQSVTKEIEKVELAIQEIYGSNLPQISASIDLGHSFAHYIPYTIQNRDDGDWSAFVAPDFVKAPLTPGTAATGDTTPVYTPVTMSQPGTSEPDYVLALPRNNLTAALSLRQPIFLQGKARIGLKIARTRQALLVCRYEEEKNRIKSETVKLFYRVLLEQQRGEICKERCALSEESHRLTKVNFTFARSRELDTLNSLLRLEQARIDCNQAERERRCACEAIIAQCGCAESSSTFWVEGVFPEPVFFITIDEALVQLHHGNFQIKQFRGNETVRNELINLAKADYLPVLFCGGTVGRVGQFSEIDKAGDIHWGNDQKVFIGFSWTLFSGLTRKQVVRQQTVERDLLLLTQQKTIDGLELTMRTTFERVMIYKERLSSLQAVIGIARKSYSIAKKAMEIGSGTPLDLQNAELELSKAKLAYNEALYEFHCAATDFKFLIGSL